LCCINTFNSKFQGNGERLTVSSAIYNAALMLDFSESFEA